MANIRQIDCSKQYSLKSKKCYKVTGPLSISNVYSINQITNKIILIFDNTRGQDAEIIEKLNPSKVEISVIGGLDYLNKRKFNTTSYIERTMHSPLELAKIIKYFEKIERKIKPSWTQLEKSMFVYKILTQDLHYRYDYENEYENGEDIVRSLSGLLYKRLVCSGFALVFKEAMDRIGVPCVYQNRQGHHSWNILKIEGEYRAVELTWECYNKRNNECSFDYFNQTPNFYENPHHDISGESEEISYRIVPFSKDKIAQHRKRVESSLFEIYPSSKATQNTTGDVKYIELYNNNPNIREILVTFDNKIVPVYLPVSFNPKQVLTKSNIMYAELNNFCIGNVSIPNNYPKSNLYKRYDGTTFIIRGNNSRFSTSSNVVMNEFQYFELDSTGNIRRATIVSENSLDLENDPIRINLIANNLLSADRLKRKMNNYNGYVGYIGNDSRMYYTRDFEQNDLNIYTRK